MKKSSYLVILQLLSISIFFVYCNEDEPLNKPPTCSITNPSEGEQIPLGDTIEIAVEAIDDDGEIISVRLFIDDNDKGFVNSLPYKFEWFTIHEDIGDHKITVLVIDDSKASVTKDINISLTPGVFNTVTDLDGNQYKTVKIGDQEWMAENLKVTKTQEGTDIPLVTDASSWQDLPLFDSTLAYCYYNNNENGEKDKYGALYTFGAAKAACPSGWHLPSEVEWAHLEAFVKDHINSDSTAQALKATSGWDWGANGNNNFGFSALPGGARSEFGGFLFGGHGANWWTSTEHNDYKAYYRFLTGIDMASGYHLDNSYGLSVRCVKNH